MTNPLPVELPHNFSPSPQLLAHKVIAITGAAAGIGKALAIRCAELGATPVLLDKHIPGLEATYDEIEARTQTEAAIIPIDFTGATEKDYELVAQTLDKEFGKLDGLINNAGWMSGYTPLKHYTTENYFRNININLHAPFLLTRACLPLLEKTQHSAIVFSAHSSNRAYAGAFGMAKAGALSLMSILADEYDGDTFIRVNAVDPGAVNTTMRRLHFPGEVPESNPAPDAQEILNPYLYLLSDEAGQTTGQLYTRTATKSTA